MHTCKYNLHQSEITYLSMFHAHKQTYVFEKCTYIYIHTHIHYAYKYNFQQSEIKVTYVHIFVTAPCPKNTNRRISKFESCAPVFVHRPVFWNKI